MTRRRRPPNKCPTEKTDFVHDNIRFELHVDRYDDGRPAGMFLSGGKSGTAMNAISRDAGMLVSLALQHGAGLETIRDALTRDDDGAPMSVIGVALDRVAEDNS